MGTKIFKSIREEFAPYFRRAQKINSMEGRCSTVIVKEKYTEFLDKVIAHEGIELEDKVLILLLYMTGCRVSEIVGQGEEDGLTIGQLDLVRGRIHGVKILKKRGRKLLLEKPIYEGAISTLQAWVNGKDKTSKVVSMSRKSAGRRIYKYFGFTDVHSTRHSFVTNAMEEGIDPVKISYMQGWSDARFGFRYMNCDTEQELDTLFKKKAS